MGKTSEFIDNWAGRVANGLAIYPFIPAGILALAGGWLSTSVAWIDELGPFGWFCAALVTFVVSSASLAMLARTRLWRVEAKIREKLSGDSSAFDPMATEYHNKRLFLRDLAPAGRSAVIGKTFYNCEIIGPGTIKLSLRSDEAKPWPVLTRNTLFLTDCIETDPHLVPQNAVFFPDCSFHGCHFYNLTLMFDHREDGAGWNWITRDYRSHSPGSQTPQELPGQLIEQAGKPGAA